MKNGKPWESNTQVNLKKIKERKNRSRDVSFYVVCNTQITRNAHLFLRCKGPPRKNTAIKK